METPLRETIKSVISNHLDAGYQVYGQCLTAVGWVGGTLPEKYEQDGMIELSMADVAGGGFVVGAALMGKRPIYVIRYQGFGWYNLISVLNYACKSKEMWKKPCPMLIRSIAMEGSIGPVASSSHHSIAYRMPGIQIYSPMTGSEYTSMYNDFMSGDDVFYCSEHRGSFPFTGELVDIEYENPDIVLFPISITRFSAVSASKILYNIGIKASVYHQVKLKPYDINPKWTEALNCGKGLVIDDDYPDGMASVIAQKLMLESNAKVYSIGLENKSAGFASHLDNLPPDENKIVEFVRKLHEKN